MTTAMLPYVRDDLHTRLGNRKFGLAWGPTEWVRIQKLLHVHCSGPQKVGSIVDEQARALGGRIAHGLSMVVLHCICVHMQWS
jgi:hypothetical protein